MAKKMALLLVVVLAFGLVACADTTTEDIDTSQEVDYSGIYIGYSWKGESKGVSLEDATQKIQTILELDKDGTIIEADMLFWKLIDGHWTTRQSGNATVKVDFSVEPGKATPGENYTKGDSMFDVVTVDMMSFYTVAVDEDGTAAVLIAEPTTRYQLEMKLGPGYDYATEISDVTVDSGQLVPTVRLSSSGLIKVNDWSELDGKDIFNFHDFGYVLNQRGIFKGLSSTSTVQELMEKMGVVFTDGKPEPTDEMHGFTSNGGWAGNYEAIGEFLEGKNALELISLVDWSTERWMNAVNEENFFGVDVVAGATKTAQNSYDTIAGATVRMSRESTSFQRALVKAGIIDETEVIKGRF